MAKEIIIDNEFISVWYHPEKKIIHHEFHKFTEGNIFREGLSSGAQVLENNHVQKWLSDDRKNSVLTEEDRKWTSTEWRPRVLKAGWKFWAIVLPEKVVGQMSMKRIIEEYAKTGVTVKIFDDPENALDWLEMQ
jgi:hypothetical protein